MTSEASGTDGDDGSGSLTWGRAVRISLVPWLVTRVLTFVTLIAVRASGSEGVPTGTGFLDGLLHWDGQWYARIAEDGYRSVGDEAFRFFPLLPMLGRLFGVGSGADVGVVIAANLASLAALVVICRLVVHEGRSVRFAVLVTWVVALAPHAFVSAMAYAEPLFLFLTAVSMYLWRQKRWWASVPAGLLAGLTRPFAVLLVVPAIFEVVRDWRGAAKSERVGMVAAAAAPVAGLGTYLGWVWRVTGDPLMPFTVQQGDQYRGDFVFPIWRVITGLGDAAAGSGITAAHLLWLAVFVAASVEVVRRWPSSYGALAVVVLLTATASENLDGLERYLWSVLPIPLGVADLLARLPRPARIVMLVASAAALLGYAGLAFDGRLVP